MKRWTICLVIGVFAGVLRADANPAAMRIALKKGADYLAGRVNQSGRVGSVSYRQRDGGAEAWAALALYRAGRRPEQSAALKRLLDSLAAHDSSNPTARAATAMLWLETNRTQDLKKDLDWLVGNQGTDGGWGPNPKESSNIVDTAFVLLVLRAAAQSGRGIPEGVWNDARRFLQSCSNTGGGFGYQALDAKPFRLRGTSNAFSTAAAIAGAGAIWRATGNDDDKKIFTQGRAWLERNPRLDMIPRWVWGDPPLMTYLYLLTEAADAEAPMQLGRLKLESLGEVLLKKQAAQGGFQSYRQAEDTPVATALSVLMLERLQRRVVLLAWGLNPSDANALAAHVAGKTQTAGDWRKLNTAASSQAGAQAPLICLSGPTPPPRIEPFLTRAVKRGQKILIMGRAPFVDKIAAALGRGVNVSAKPMTDLAAIGGDVTAAKTIRHDGQIAALFLTTDKPATDMLLKGADLLTAQRSGTLPPGEFSSKGILEIGWVSHKGDWQANNRAVGVLNASLAAAVSRGLKARTVFSEKAITPPPMMLWLTGTNIQGLDASFGNHLRTYLNAGGLLVIDPAKGGKKAFEQGKAVLELLYGKGAVRPLGGNSSVLTGRFGGGLGNDIRNVSLNPAGAKLSGASETQPLLWAVVQDGRALAVLSRYALAGSVRKSLGDDSPGYKASDAQKIILNLILYAYAARHHYESDAAK